MSARKTNTSILVIGLIGVILLGIMMWYMGDKADIRAYNYMAGALDNSGAVGGSDFSVQPAFNDKGGAGVTASYFPDAGILARSDEEVRIEAEKAALVIYEESGEIARASRNRIDLGGGPGSPETFRMIESGFVTVIMKSQGGFLGCSEREERKIELNRGGIADRMAGWFSEISAKRPELMKNARYEYHLPRAQNPGVIIIYLFTGVTAPSESDGAAIAGEISGVWKYGVGKIIFVESNNRRREFTTQPFNPRTGK